ncbi:hypothetical protein D3C73_951830 [compost metagenome]
MVCLRIEAQLVKSPFSQRYNGLRLDGVRVPPRAADIHLEVIPSADWFQRYRRIRTGFLIQHPMRRIRDAHSGIAFLMLGETVVVDQVAVCKRRQ